MYTDTMSGMGISTSGVWESAEATGRRRRYDPKTSSLRRVRSQGAQESRLGASGVGVENSENARQRAI